jgi:dTDP-4-amino-4,6-dideoxygalactose transaminase
VSAANIPFVDLAAQSRNLAPELFEAFKEVVDSAAFVGGPAVEQFERDFAMFCGTRHCVGVGSGTDALRFALIAGGVKAGDTVITVPNTFIATTEAITQAGAEPAFVDVDERTYTMHPERLREYIEGQCVADGSGRMLSLTTGKPVTAVVPVHLYGQPTDMDPILELAEQYRLLVVEDACQAHGAEYWSRKTGGWRKVGSLGHAAAFSFYPGKNLGACGEAGAITTDNDGIARISGMLRDHGQAKKYHHEIEGYNGRLDAIQGALLSVKLMHLSGWNEKRRGHALLYDTAFRNACTKIVVPYQAQYSRSVYHLYVIRTPDRDELRSSLSAAGIGTGIHYPIPLHLQKAYADRECAIQGYPVAERIASEIISLPMFPELSVEQQNRVVEGVVQHTRRTAKPLAFHAAAS